MGVLLYVLERAFEGFQRLKMLWNNIDIGMVVHQCEHGDVSEESCTRQMTGNNLCTCKASLQCGHEHAFEVTQDHEKPWDKMNTYGASFSYGEQYGPQAFWLP